MIRGQGRLVLSVVLALFAALLVIRVPRSAGTTWSEVGDALLAVPPLAASALALLWIAGLACNSVALAASLPGLTVRRALLLSLSGSAVANVLPLGGAAGVALNYAMTRRWGFTVAGFSTYTATTNLLDVAAKLVLIAAAGVVLVVEGPTPVMHLGAPSLALLAVPPLMLGFLLRPAKAARLGGWLDYAAQRAGRVVRRTITTDLRRRLPQLAHRTGTVLRDSWRRLVAGTAGYAVLLALLFAACLHVAGVHLTLPLIVAGLAVDRVLTMASITPGGVGIVESGLVLAVIALGAAPEPAVSGVLLYRAFTYFAEIPVGGLSAAVWALRRARVSVPSDVSGAAACEEHR